MGPGFMAVGQIMSVLSRLERAGVASNKTRVVMTTPLFDRIKSEMADFMASPLTASVAGYTIVVFDDSAELWYVAVDWGVVDEEADAEEAQDGGE